MIYVFALLFLILVSTMIRQLNKLSEEGDNMAIIASVLVIFLVILKVWIFGKGLGLILAQGW